MSHGNRQTIFLKGNSTHNGVMTRIGGVEGIALEWKTGSLAGYLRGLCIPLTKSEEGIGIGALHVIVAATKCISGGEPEGEMARWLIGWPMLSLYLSRVYEYPGLQNGMMCLHFLRACSING